MTTTMPNRQTYNNGYTDNNRTPNNKSLPKSGKAIMQQQTTTKKLTNLSNGVPTLSKRSYRCPKYTECEGHSLEPRIKCNKCGVMVGCFYDHPNKDENSKYCHTCYTAAEFTFDIDK